MILTLGPFFAAYAIIQDGLHLEVNFVLFIMACVIQFELKQRNFNYKYNSCGFYVSFLRNKNIFSEEICGALTLRLRWYGKRHPNFLSAWYPDLN